MKIVSLLGKKSTYWRYIIFWTTGFLLILAGVFMPQDWYDALPKQTALPPSSIKGITLLQLSFMLEGLALIFLSFNHWKFVRLHETDRLDISTRRGDEGVITQRASLWLLIAITLLGLVLRLVNANSDLWLDEITPILDYGNLSIVQIMGTYLSTNNHLLSTILVKLMIDFFGEQEWAIRLPAILSGTASIPALYWLARMMMSRVASLSSALLLAVSYHHIFYSQNARGYSLYVLFSLLSIGLLVHAFQEDRLRTWLLYLLATLLNFASILISAFVFGSQVLLGGFVLLAIRRRGGNFLPMARRLIAVFGIATFLGFQLYSLIIPKAVIMQQVYKGEGSGFAPFSLEFLNELLRGLSAGISAGSMLLAIPLLITGAIVAGIGFVILARRHWPLAFALIMPGVLDGGFLIVRGLTFSPRFFILALPVAFLAVVQGVFSIIRFMFRRLMQDKYHFANGFAMVLVLLGSAASIVSLKNYYTIPKQPYRASIQFVESVREPEDIVIVVYTAEKGVHYYGKRLGVDVDSGKTYFFVRTAETLEQVLASHNQKDTYFVTTFHRALRIRFPEIEARIRKDWEIMRIFPATIGDGQMAIWAPRAKIVSFP